MAASSFQLFILAVNGRAVKGTKDMEAIFKTLSVSADGNDNGLTISESSGHFGFNSKRLTGVADPSGAQDAATKNYADTTFIPLSQKGANNGVATLDANGKLPSSQVPPLAVTSVSVAADEAAQLALTLEEGDVVIRTDESKTYVHNGGTAGTMADFTEIVTPGTGVQTVNGQAGPNVVLDTDDIDEGSTNLYFTNARFDARFDTQLATKDTGDLAEGSNLYFTNARAIAAPLTGYSKGAGTVAATDTILQAIQKLDGNDDLKQDKSDLYRTLQNKEGGSTAHTIRQIAYLSAFGQAKLAQATAAGLSEKTVFLLVRDSSIADDASGTYWLPKKGTVVGGFSSLVFDEPVYLSRTAAGGYQVTAPSTANDHVVRIGYAISATEIIFDPCYEYQVA